MLVDFWTYSCINCLRTLPHLEAWDRAYREAGLTIVGVHSRVRVRARARQRPLGGARGSASVTRSRSTTTSRRGAPTPTTTGLPSTSSTGPATSATSTTARARTTRPRRPSASCSARRRAWRTSVADTDAAGAHDARVVPRIRAARSLRHADSRSSTRPRATASRERLRQDELAYAGTWTVEPSRIVAGANARLGFASRPGTSSSCWLERDGGRRSSRPRPGGRVHVSGTPRLYTLARFPG